METVAQAVTTAKTAHAHISATGWIGLVGGIVGILGGLIGAITGCIGAKTGRKALQVSEKAENRAQAEYDARKEAEALAQTIPPKLKLTLETMAVMAKEAATGGRRGIMAIGDTEFQGLYNELRRLVSTTEDRIIKPAAEKTQAAMQALIASTEEADFYSDGAVRERAGSAEKAAIHTLDLLKTRKATRS